MAIDAEKYRALLEYAGRRFGQYVPEEGSTFVDPNSIPAWSIEDLLNFDYQGRYANVNPFGTLGIRDALRQTATSLGLTTEDADKAALDYLQQSFAETGQPYSEASHPAIIADRIAKSLYQQAGRDYQGLTPEQYASYVEQARGLQDQFKERDSEAWKQDEFAGNFGAWTEQIQNKYEGDTQDPRRFLLGADNPWNTWFWNKVLNKDWDPYGNEVGLPTKQNYQQASNQGYDVAAAAFVNKWLQQWGTAVAGGATSDLSSMGTNAAGIDPAYLDYAKQAKDYASYYKAWQNYKANGELNIGAFTGAATKIGDFDSSAFTGSDSPFTSNSIFTDSGSGNNFSGGSNMDEWFFNDQTGEWELGDPNALENQLNQYPTDYQVDPYSQAYTDQLNQDLGADTGGSGGGGSGGNILSGLGNLFGSGGSLSGLLGGLGGNANSALALAPILAAIQQARNQGPYDTSRLESMFDQYNPSSLAYTYDRNTEDQRRALTSSLADRGVMGSSFGNMDLTNFNTNRELGRGALISQGALGGADIANKILQAQIERRKQQNQMYGSALYALGNVFRAGR